MLNQFYEDELGRGIFLYILWKRIWWSAR